MRELFQDLMTMEGIRGILLLSEHGEIIFKEFSTPVAQDPEKREWGYFINSLNGIRETDVVYEKARLYVRKTELGYLLILMDFFVSAAMVRLNCDILLPSLKSVKGSKGIKRLFKK